MNLLDDIPVGVPVGLDTSPFIYVIESHPVYGPVVEPLFRDRMEKKLNLGVSSVVTVSEVLTQPLKTGRQDLVHSYCDILYNTPSLAVAEITTSIAERAADLRARYSPRLPDAFQLATALARGATVFLTNDIKLKKVTDLTVLVLDDYLAPPTP